jgi:ABC-2 type transport system ATP-binding protein
VQIIDQGQLILNETIAGLNRHMDSGTLEVSTRMTSDINSLLAIPGVNSIERINDHRVKIHHSVTANPAEQIAEHIIAAGWGLQELIPIKRSMEDIFISLTKEHREL